MTPEGEPGSWIDGDAAGLEEALSVAADLLSDSRQPLFAGLGADVAGTRAAVLLAERLGGVIDHMHSGSLLRDLDVMRETGVMLTTPGETIVRADTVLLVGESLFDVSPALLRKILATPARPESGEGPRRVIWLAMDAATLPPDYAGRADRLTVGVGPNRAASLAVLRAMIKGRPVAATHLSPHLIEIAEALQASRFGVALWNSGELDAMTIEMLNGLVRDLNETIRFSTLPIPSADNGAGVLAVCGWTTGFPMRTGFGRGMPEHDPWKFDSHRLVAQRETDCIVWLSAFGTPPPAEWPAPAIAVVESGTPLTTASRVRITVGRPGRDHEGVLYDPDIGTLTAVPASARAQIPSVGQILSLLGNRLPDRASTR
jgi:formylmethanofuran dehydrogenase subunit B